MPGAAKRMLLATKDSADNIDQLKKESQELIARLDPERYWNKEYRKPCFYCMQISVVGKPVDRTNEVMIIWWKRRINKVLLCMGSCQSEYVWWLPVYWNVCWMNIKMNQKPGMWQICGAQFSTASDVMKDIFLDQPKVQEIRQHLRSTLGAHLPGFNRRFRHFVRIAGYIRNEQPLLQKTSWLFVPMVVRHEIVFTAHYPLVTR